MVAVLETAGHKRWIGIEHVLQSKRKRRVIQPSAPSTRVVLSSGNRCDIFFFVVLHLYVLTAVFRKARHPADAGGGRLNVYDAIKSSVVHAATFRARGD